MLINQNDFRVYVHTNKTNGKKYIGITCQPIEQRWKHGEGYKRCSVFYNAIQKYGWDGFKHDVLFEGLTSEKAKEKEQELILAFKTMDRKYGYNLTSGGDSGTHLSIDAKMHHSIALIGHKLSDETKKKISNACIGKTISNEAKLKISKAFKGRFAGEKNPMYGKTPSAETREKLSKASKRFWEDKEYRENHCEMSKSLWEKEGHREKMQEAHKGERNGMYGKAHSPEVRKKLSEINKGRINSNTKSVICLETNEVYDSLKGAANICNISESSLGKCCRGERKYAGKSLKDCKPLHWMYYKEYLSQEKEGA